jgi:hypothetical protein
VRARARRGEGPALHGPESEHSGATRREYSVPGSKRSMVKRTRLLLSFTSTSLIVGNLPVEYSKRIFLVSGAGARETVAVSRLADYTRRSSDLQSAAAAAASRAGGMSRRRHCDCCVRLVVSVSRVRRCS